MYYCLAINSSQSTAEKIMAYHQQYGRASYSGNSSCSNNDLSIEIYTDGACLNNGQQGAQAGIGGYFGLNNPLNFSERVKGRQTNNVAEIQAAEHAIRLAKLNGYVQIKIITDSEFLTKAVYFWLPKWKANNWRTAGGGPVKNKEDFELLIDAMQGVEVVFEHVRGHQGNFGNEQADRLARAGAAKPASYY
ncbi:unnamed protein product [Allacma fusca]|uniref:ribonuclease H n=1 Tax=Allacma fusca TaxID=39272 RepID=A0A8J2PXA7_9HEXA|nr:unnamed protein product [Allacma fusca]